MNRIRELRQSMGWTQAQLGKKIGAAKSTVSEYESETHQLDPKLICDLCDLFGCTADYLLGRSNNSIAVFTDDEADMILAFRDAAPNIQQSIRLQLNLNNPEKKKAVAAS